MSVDASPAAVWAVLSHLEGWAAWDQGITAVSDAGDGLVEGGTCRMAFSGGIKARTTFTRVRRERGLVWRAEGALVVAEGHFDIEPTESGCEMRYRFGMAGVLGFVVNLLAFEAVIATGTRKDLEEIKKLAEAG